MYETDCDDYEYQQSRMEFAGPDDYDFEPPYDLPDYSEYDDYCGSQSDSVSGSYYPDPTPTPDEIIKKAIRYIGNKMALSEGDSLRYFRFLKKYRCDNSYTPQELQKLDARLLIIVANAIIERYGFYNWFDSLSDTQIKYVRNNIDRFHKLSSIEKKIVLDHVDYSSVEDIYTVPLEAAEGFSGFLMRNATKEEMDRVASLLPELGKREHRMRNISGRNGRIDTINSMFKEYYGVMEYILINYSERMSKETRLEFLKYVLMYSSKDVLGDGRIFNYSETAKIKELLEKAGVDKEFLKAHREEYVDGIFENLYKKALNKFLDSDDDGEFRFPF